MKEAVMQDFSTETPINGIPAGQSESYSGYGASEAGKSEPLSSEEQKEVTKLKQRDQEVKTHEQAHRAAGGQYIRGSVNYEYETGPDGKKYATGGEVSIDLSTVPDDPEATIRKMQVVKKAALAPANPSTQDRQVAMKASQLEMQARMQLMKGEEAGEETGEKEQNFALSDEERGERQGISMDSPYGRTGQQRNTGQAKPMFVDVMA